MTLSNEDNEIQSEKMHENNVPKLQELFLPKMQIHNTLDINQLNEQQNIVNKKQTSYLKNPNREIIDLSEPSFNDYLTISMVNRN